MLPAISRQFAAMSTSRPSCSRLNFNERASPFGKKQGIGATGQLAYRHFNRSTHCHEALQGEELFGRGEGRKSRAPNIFERGGAAKLAAAGYKFRLGVVFCVVIKASKIKYLRQKFQAKGTHLGSGWNRLSGVYFRSSSPEPDITCQKGNILLPSGMALPARSSWRQELPVLELPICSYTRQRNVCICIYVS
jgi:hypothetical protein